MNLTSLLTTLLLGLLVACGSNTTDTLTGTSASATHSQLWGTSGEQWDSDGILRDFTHAGYKGGAVPIPDVLSGGSVKDFGAAGDGVTDDTKAFKRAIASCDGAIDIPAGTYIISDRLIIERSNCVLRGAGTGATVLKFTRGLNDIDPRYTETYQGIKVSVYSWSGGLIWVDGGVRDVGIEHLTLAMPNRAYPGHWRESGFNGIALRKATHSWIRNVEFRDVDMGIRVDGSHNSILSVRFTNSGRRAASDDRSSGRSLVGHHGIYMRYGSYNLFHDVTYAGQFKHDLSVAGEGSYGNVFSSFRGEDINIDHHDKLTRGNLFTDFDLGQGTRPFESGGSNYSDPRNEVIAETFWSLRGSSPTEFPPARRASIFVAVGTAPTPPSSEDAYYEAIDPYRVSPRNLYVAQQRRAGRWVPTTGSDE